MKDTDDARPRRSTSDDDVTASEVAAYAYCAKAWHLERVLGKPVDGSATSRRAAGVDRHLEHGARLARGARLGRRALPASVMLLILAAVLFAAAMLL
jgi:hypothetical protein